MNDELKQLLQYSSGDKKAPVYLQIYRGVRRALERGLLKPGERMPTDMELANELGVNHLTLKKTLNRLAQEGFLIRVRGRGTFVASELPNSAPPFLTGNRVSLLYDKVTEESLRSDVFIAIYKCVSNLGMTLELVSSNGDRKLQFKQIVNLFSSQESGGCIVWPIMDCRQLEQLAAARPKGYPLIFINHKPELDIGGIDFSGYDDFGAGRMLGEHILSQGYDNIVVLHEELYMKCSTNVNRVAGLTVGLGRKKLKVFTDFNHRIEVDCRKQLERELQKVKNDGKRTAVVFISEMDFEQIQDSPVLADMTPFVFFTGHKPCCSGVLLSSMQMGQNAVKILEMRRKGDDSFVLSQRVDGVLV